MRNLNTILVATDLSELSLAAVTRGLALAQQQGLECTILNVLSRDLVFSLQGILGPSSKSVERDAIQKQTQELNRIVSGLLQGRQLNVMTRLRLGPAAQEIANQAEEDNAELIVVSSHGQGAVKRLLVGSTTMGVLHVSPCPVLVVKTSENVDYQTVLLMIDFSDTTAAVIETALRYAPKANFVFVNLLEGSLDEMARLALVNQEQISTLRQQAMAQAHERLEQLAQDSGLAPERYSIEVLEGDLDVALPELEARHACELVVTGKHGHHATRDRILGSFTQSILHRAQTDVLVAQPRNT